MSLLDEATTQQVVYGPDGKAYGNPAIARNAGVNQYYREDGTPYPVAIPAASGMGSGDPYSQIMGQMGGATPYQRIMAQMTPAMNPYTGAGQVMGGYDPSFQGGYDPGLYSRLTRSGLINTGGGGMGGGGGGGGDNPQPLSQQTIDFFDNETKEQRDDRMGRVNSVLQGIVNFTVPGVGLINALPSFLSSAALGRVNNALNPLGLINYDIPVEDAVPTFVTPEDRYGFVAEQPSSLPPSPEAQYGFVAEQPGSPAPDTGGGGSYDSGDYGGYSGSETQSSGESYANFKGGMVTNVFGPNPAGPDDGAGMLQLGEYVIKKSAVNKYGKGLLDMINDGKIPAKKMKSLLG